MKKQYEEVYRDYQSKVEMLSKLQQEKNKLVRDNASLEQLSQLSTKIIEIEHEIKLLKTQYEAKLKEFEQLNQNNDGLVARQTQLAQKTEEHEKAVSEYDSAFEEIESILARHSTFLGKRLDTDQMVAKQIPATELINGNLDKVIEEKNAAAFDEVLAKLHNVNATDSKGMTLLMHCLKHGFWHGVEKLLSLGADVNILDNNGANALIYACAMPHIKYIKAIAELTKDLQTKSADGNTALHYLIQAKKILFYSELPELGIKDGALRHIDSSVTVDVSNAVIPCVLMGARANDAYTINEHKVLSIMQFLTDKGAKIDAVNKLGLSPFFLAVKGVNKYLSNKLLELYKVPLEEHKTMLDENGSGLIHYSIIDVNLLKTLIDRGFNLNYPSKDGGTALHQAVWNAKLEIVEFLVGKGANIHCVDKNNMSVVHWAAHSMYDGSKCIEFLVGKGIDIDAKNNLGETALNFYSSLPGSKPEFAELLVRNGANIDAKSSNQVTPLYKAVVACNLPLVSKLLELNANTNIPAGNGFFPIHGAAHVGSSAIIEKLIAKGVDIDTKSASGYTALNYYCALANSKPEFADFLLKKGANINSQNGVNVTPFYSACMAGNVQMVKFLHSSGANIDLLNANGFHAIHGAIHYGKIDVVEELVKIGVPIDKLSNNGYTPLQYYCEQANAKVYVVEFLLAKGASLTSKQDGKTLLHSAVTANNPELIELLVNKGVPVDSVDSQGFSALYYACQMKDNLQIVKTLIANKADVNITAESGDRPINVACSYSTLEVVDYLLKSGADLASKNKLGGVQMHQAFHTANIPVIDYLISLGCSFSSQTNDGKTPIMTMLINQQITSEQKLKVIEKYASKIDVSIKDKEGKNVSDYLKTYCPEAIKFVEANNANTEVESLQSAVDSIVIFQDMKNDSGIDLSGDHHHSDS